MYIVTVYNNSDKIIESGIFDHLLEAKEFGVRWAGTFDFIEIRYTENNLNRILVADMRTEFNFIEL